MSAASADVVFVDLDGTLVLDNSFHAFVRACWRHGRTPLRADLVGVAARRAVRRRSGRLQMKHALVRAFARLDDSSRQRIVEEVLSMMRSTISHEALDRIRAYQRSGAVVVMATAALDCYAEPFAQALEFDDCLATSTKPDGAWRELLGVAKADACRSWLEAHRGASASAARTVVLTDHVDDLPLLLQANDAVIFASRSRFADIRDQLPDTVRLEHVDPASEQEDGGIWLWFDDGPSGPHDAWEVRTILSKHRYALLYTGDGEWQQIRPGQALADAALRVDCPTPPPTTTRITTLARRRLVRDRLMIFH